MDKPAAAPLQAKKRKTRKRKATVSSQHDRTSKDHKKVRRPDLSSWTVAQLRSACRKEGLTTQGAKRDLVERYAKRMEAVQDSVFDGTQPHLPVASADPSKGGRDASAPNIKPQRRKSTSPSARTRRLRQENAARQERFSASSSNRRRRGSSSSAAATRSPGGPSIVGPVERNRPSPIKLPESAASAPAAVSVVPPHSSHPSSDSCSDTEASNDEEAEEEEEEEAEEDEEEESGLGKSLSVPLSAAKAALDASATAATLAVTEPLQAIAKSLQARGILPTQQNFDDAWQRISQLRSDLAARLTTGSVEGGDGEESSVSGVHGDVLTLSERLARSRDELMERIRESMADSFSFFSWAYMSRLLAAICLFFFTGYVNAVCASCAGYRTPYVRLFRIVVNEATTGPELQMIPEGNGSYVIPDIGLDAVAWLGQAFLPESWIKEGGVDWLEGPDLFVTVHGFLLLGFLFISPQRLKIVRRLFVIYSFLNLLRAFTVIATSLPDPTPKCRMQFHNLTGDGAYKLKPMFPAVLWRAFKVMNMAPTCGDCVFSGHSTLMLLVMKTFTEYFHSSRLHGLVSRPVGYAVRAFMRVLTSVGLLVVLSTKFHYTLDIAIAIFLNLRIWDSYHMFTRTLVLRGNTIDDPLARLMHWFESEEIIGLEHRVYGATAPTVTLDPDDKDSVQTPTGRDEPTQSPDGRTEHPRTATKTDKFEDAANSKSSSGAQGGGRNKRRRQRKSRRDRDLRRQATAEVLRQQARHSLAAKN